MLTVLTLVLATALPVFAEDTPEEEEAWDVLAEHGPVHTATIDTTEGTWMSVQPFTREAFGPTILKSSTYTISNRDDS